MAISETNYNKLNLGQIVPISWNTKFQLIGKDDDDDNNNNNNNNSNDNTVIMIWISDIALINSN